LSTRDEGINILHVQTHKPPHRSEPLRVQKLLETSSAIITVVEDCVKDIIKCPFVFRNREFHLELEVLNLSKYYLKFQRLAVNL